MKFLRSLMPATIIACGLGAGARAEVLFRDAFEYPEGVKLADTEGGFGTWNGPWIVDESATDATITSLGLRFGDGVKNPSATPGTPAKLAKRAFAKYSGPVVYLKFVFSAGPGTTTNADRFGVFLPSTKHGALMVGAGLTGSGGAEASSNTISARVFDNGENRITSATTLAPETVYTVVVEWSKATPGASQPYNRMRMWLDPKPDDLTGPPPKELNFKECRPELSWVGFFVADTEPGDVFFVREVALATTWKEIVGP